jgi:branched-chain amino acid transport system permease protein
VRLIITLKHRFLALGALSVVGILLPFLFPKDLNSITTMLYYMMLALSWNLIMGYTGIFSFGHMGFALVGGYTTALLVLRLDISPFLGLIAGGIAAALVSLLLGAVCLRLRGFYLTLVTWAFAEILITVLTVEHEITGGSMGLTVRGFFKGTGMIANYYIGLILVVLLGLFLILIMNSRIGIYLKSIRDDEGVSEVLGINTVFWKLFSFTVTGFWAGIAGAFYTHHIGVIDPSAGSLTVLSMVFLMVIVGGIGTMIGPVIGTVFVMFLSEFLSGKLAEMSVLIFAGLMIIAMMFFRDGMVGAFRLPLEKLLNRKNRDLPGKAAS